MKFNMCFGIEENLSDQIWFYGFFAVSLSMLLVSYLIYSVTPDWVTFTSAVTRKSKCL